MKTERPEREVLPEPTWVVESRDVRNCRLFAYAGSAVAIAVGILALLGWLLRIPIFTSIFPGLATMKPITALCFVFAGISLWLIRLQAGELSSPRIRDVHLARILAGLVGLGGVLTLVEYRFGVDLWFEEALFHRTLQASGILHPGRMSGATALGFLLLGLSVEFLTIRRAYLAQSLALLASLNGFVACLGYLFGVRSLYDVPAYSSMALHTAILFSVTGAAALAARPQLGLMAAITSERMGGLLGRLVLPLVIAVPILFGWLRLRGQQAGLFGLEFGIALRTIGEVVALGTLLWLSTMWLNRVDEARYSGKVQIETQLQMLDMAADPILMCDEEDRILYWNKGAEATYGWSKGEATGKRIFDLLHTSYPIPLQEIKNVLLSDGNWKGELRRTRKDGSVLLIASSWTLRRTSGNSFIRLESGRDITEQKKAEERLREREDHYRDLVEHSSDLICTHSLDGRLLFVNELPAKILGYSREEMLGKPMRDFLLPEARAQFDEALLTIQKEGFIKGKMVVLAKSGEWRIWEYHNTLRSEGLAVPIVRGIAHDITEQKQLQRAVKLSEEKFAKAFHASPAEIMICTLREGVFLDVNEAFLRNSGYSREEIIGHTPGELGMWKNPEEQAAILEEIRKQGRLPKREFSFQTKTGETRIKRYSGEKIEIGSKHCLLAVGEDITEQKQAQEALLRSEEQFRTMANAMPQLAWMANPDGWIFWYNQGWYDYTGSTPEQMEGWGWQSVHDPAELHNVMERWQSSIATGKPFEMVFPLRSAQGEFRAFLTRVSPIKDSSGKVLRWFGTNTDVEESKRAEAALRESEQRFRGLFQASPVGMYLFDAIAGGEGRPNSYRFLDVNPAFERFTGIKAADCIGRTVFEVVPDADPAVVEGQARAALTGVTESFAAFTPRINKHWESTTYSPRQGVGISVVVDVTERKMAEEAQRRSEANFRSLFEQAPDGIFTTDGEGKFLDANRAGLQMLGYSLEELRHISVRDILPAEELPRLKPGLDRLAKGELVAGEWRFQPKGESTRYGELVAKRLTDGRLQAILRDISDRKQAQQAVQESEEKFRTLADLVPQMVWMCTPDGLNIYFNQRWVDYTGMSLEESYGRGWNTPFHDDDKQRAWDAWNKAVATGESYMVESRLRAADGSYRWFLMRGAPLRDASGNIVKWFGTCTDIEDMKQAEAALRESEASLREAQGIAHIGSYDFDFASETWKSSEELDELLGIDAGYERSLAGWLALVHPDDRAKLAGYATVEGISRIQTFNQEYRIIRQTDQAVRWLWGQAILEKDAEGRAIRMRGTSMDITERKQAEAVVRESEAKFSTAFYNSSVALAIAALDGKLVEVNAAFCGMTGYTREEIIGKTSIEIGLMTPEERARMLRAVESAGGALTDAELTFRAKDGSLLDIVQSIAAISLGGVPHRLATLLDETKRKRAEKELLAQTEQLRTLSVRLQKSREEERTVVARELHDEIGQVLTGLKLDISWFARRLPKGKKEMRDKLDSTLGLVDSGMRWVRKLCTQLRPGILDDLGIAAAIEWQAKEFEIRTAIHCKVSLPPGNVELDQERSTAVFRIFQEALTNVSRHSKATQVEVSLREENDNILLSIRDNGIGIKTDGGPSRSFGLLGMRERALVFGGKVEFSGAGGGTTVTVSIPRPRVALLNSKKMENDANSDRG